MGPLSLSWERFVVAVQGFDNAIRCPGCGHVQEHPLPGVRIGEPHPVSRCLGGGRDSPTSCLVHGDELDQEGLCAEGRAIFDRALVDVTGPRAKDRDLVEAMVRARRWALARLDDAQLARDVVTSPMLAPVFAAVAAADPEAARTLEQITGAPLDPAAADPTIKAVLDAGGGLAGALAAGKVALEQFRDSVFGRPEKAQKSKALPTKARRLGRRERAR